jgi:2-oxo-4-hydroxy-4-carboxy--5-ureidoimidazoline (OHCU) decarboxylase
MSIGRRSGPRPDLAVRLAVRRYLSQEVRRLRRQGAEVLVFQPGPEDLAVMGVNPMRGVRVGEVVTTASESVRRRLEAHPSLAGVLAQR